MELKIYTANCSGNQKNCHYPNEVVIRSKEDLRRAIRDDQVFVLYKDYYRNNANFIQSCVIAMDVDNDHSDDPVRWYTAEMLEQLFVEVDHAIFPSRNHMKIKNGKAARPKYHVLFPVRLYTDVAMYTAVKAALQKKYPFFDQNALDSARFFFGTYCELSDITWHEGYLNVDEILDASDSLEEEEGRALPTLYGGTIEEGSRNNTMSHFAGRVLKRYGNCEEAHRMYLTRAEDCKPRLSEEELETIWKSAVKFFEKSIKGADDYIPPEEYNQVIRAGKFKPDDYTDMGQAAVMAEASKDSLRYTAATGFLVYNGCCWRENEIQAMNVLMDFLDLQKKDAEKVLGDAEEALIDAGVPAQYLVIGGKLLESSVPQSAMHHLFAFMSAKKYQKFAMKNRNYAPMKSVLRLTRSKLALDVTELDYDSELLNCQDGTYDLTLGIAGGRPHDPDDLITKCTACAPGDKGEKLWKDALELFFCGDQELIEYVQMIVGLAAVGKVYAEHLIIAYGDGANGKSTFWNTIARVLGDYSGKISPESLTKGCHRNVKPEMAELKGRRLVIASELEEGTQLNTGTVKQLSSVDPIEAEKKYKDPFSFQPSHTLVLYTNHLPRVNANDDGTWRRLIVIPFHAKITGNSDIKNYSEHLYWNAGPAILKWIIEGAEKAYKKEFKLTLPTVVQEAVAAYRGQNDWLGDFISDYCDVDPSYTERSGELYQQYRIICMRTGEHTRSTTDFYAGLDKLGYVRHRCSKGTFVHGLKLKEAADFLD